jgi:P-type Ca2+ transporter type 2C
MNTKTPWHTLSTDEALTQLQSSLDGLTNEEAARRLAEYGTNEVAVPRCIPSRKISFEQFMKILIFILLAAIALTALLGLVEEAMVIALIVLLALLLGFMQKYRKGLRI